MRLLLLPVDLLAFALPQPQWQRYRRGRARRVAVPWSVRLNAWLLLASTGVFLLGAWLAGHWVEAALAHAATGVAAGVVVGMAGLWLTRFDVAPDGRLHYTPNRWLVLGLTLLVAGRIGFGLLQAMHWWDGAATDWLARQGTLLAVAGLLLGHYLAYSLGLRRRITEARR